MKTGISVIIAAYQEEANIVSAIKSVLLAFKGETDDYEIIIIDDGSTDETYQLAKTESIHNKKIKIIRNFGNKGMGYSFLKAVKKVKKPYITVFPGDNDMSSSSLRQLIKHRKDADLVTAYIKNIHSRSFFRVLLSNAFVFLMNFALELNLKYYNGPFICRSASLRDLPLVSDGYTIYAELKVKLIKAGYTYLEIPFTHTGRKYGRSKAVSFRNLWKSLRIVFVLWKQSKQSGQKGER